MKLYFLPFFATITPVAQSSLRANAFAEVGERDLGEPHTSAQHLRFLGDGSCSHEGEKSTDCGAQPKDDRSEMCCPGLKCGGDKGKYCVKDEGGDGGDKDDDDDEKDDGGDSSGEKRLQLYCGECVRMCLFPPGHAFAKNCVHLHVPTVCMGRPLYVVW